MHKSTAKASTGAVFNIAGNNFCAYEYECSSVAYLRDCIYQSSLT